jgi:hypothetical protein
MATASPAAKKKPAPPVKKEEGEPEQLESLRRLHLLKEKIAREWEKEKAEQQKVEEANNPILPLSLMNEAALTKTKKGQRRAMQEKIALTKEVREKISKLDIKDKAVVRELEVELEKKTAEMQELRVQNAMFRNMITLRQESNARREAAVEKEVEKLHSLTENVCLRSNDLDRTMEELRKMNKDIQDGAAQLKSTIERQAEADLLGLIRTYRVRMREVKQQINDQKMVNYEGAKAWIDRHQLLQEDKDAASANLEALEAHNAMLITQNEELKVMTKHQAEQRETLTSKIALVKRENKRLEDQITRLEEQVLQGMRGSPAGATPSAPLQGKPSTALARSRATDRTSTAPQGGTRPPARERVGTSIFVDKRQSQAVARVKKQLETLRRSLRQVRSSHIELLQERTELEVFMRQCIEDVRRDMYRFTVVSTVPRGVAGRQENEEERSVMQEYGANEKKVLINILTSKLNVLTLLHNKMFPQKIPLSTENLGDFLDEAALGKEKRAGGASTSSSTVKRRLLTSALDSVPDQDDDRPTSGGDGQGLNTDPIAELTMDRLWSRWKEWTTTYQTGK